MTTTLQFPDLAGAASLREQITEALRGAVITGAMAAGELYSVPTLAERFGVSATPVREAILDLVSEGLIEAVRNKGFRVTELDDATLDDMAEVRSLIEVPTVARLARHYTDAWAGEFRELRAIARRITVFAETADLIPYVEADRRFHLGLLALAGNRELVAVVASLRARSRLYGLSELAASGQLARSAAEHEQLLDLIAAGDAEASADLMRAHIGHVRGVWAGRPEQPPPTL